MKRFFIILVAMWAVTLSANVFAQDVKNGQKYVVKAGDWLSKISQKSYGVASTDSTAWLSIARANGIANPDLIYPGQRLVIPESLDHLNPTTPSASSSERLQQETKELLGYLQKLKAESEEFFEAVKAQGERLETLKNFPPPPPLIPDSVIFATIEKVLLSHHNSAAAQQPQFQPRLKLAAYHFQFAAKHVGGRRVFNEGAFFTLEAKDWLRASSGTQPCQFARVTLSPPLPIWGDKNLKLKVGLNASLISHDAHFQPDNYTLGNIVGSVGATIVIDSLFSKGNLRIDWLGVGNNVRPQDDVHYYSWVDGLQTLNYETLLSLLT